MQIEETYKYARKTFSLSSPMSSWLSDVIEVIDARESTPEALPFRYMRRTAWLDVLSNVKRARSILSEISRKSVGCMVVR